MNREIILFASAVIVVLVLLHARIGDLLNIPKSQFIDAKIILKEQGIPMRGQLKLINNDYRIVFEIEDAKTIILTVSPKVYESLGEGGQGVLEYSGSRFRKFHIDKTLEEITK